MYVLRLGYDSVTFRSQIVGMVYRVDDKEFVTCVIVLRTRIGFLSGFVVGVGVEDNSAVRKFVRVDKDDVVQQKTNNTCQQQTGQACTAFSYKSPVFNRNKQL